MNVIQKPTPNKSSRKGHLPRMIVIHGDAGKSDGGTISWIQSHRSMVSYHYLVGRDGTVYQFVDEAERAWHSGQSEWGGYDGVNDISIGVSFANDGEEPYTPSQYEAGAQLVAEICKRHRIPAHLIRGHYEVSPGRKTDPWDHFDWARFYSLFGLYSGDKREQ